MDWTAGYASDIEYTSGFYQEQSPTYLSFVCLLNDMEPPALVPGFTYCELGFGRGLTVNVLAAAHPQGRFYAADFNPAHVAGARALAAEAGLDNLTLLEASFEQLAGGAMADLPQFDFITLHGIYTWVTRENQEHIAAFIGRYLKPGGVVYLSYNAMPGWTSTLPLQRLLVEWGDAFPKRSDEQVAEAAAYIKEMAAQPGGYLHLHPANEARLQALESMSRQYLVHEYMHKHWQPLYHADVARDLAQAKLEFAGSADLTLTYTRLYLSEQRKALVERFPSGPMRETMKDYFLNTSFRKDVFVRGARRMNRLRWIEKIRHYGAVLTVPRADVKLALKLSIGEVTGATAVFEPVCDALAQGPHTLEQLVQLPALQGQAVENIVQALSLLSASGQAALYGPDGPGQAVASAHRINRVLAGAARYSDEFQVLCSPLLGNALPAGFIDRLLYLAMLQNPGVEQVDILARSAWSVMQANGRRMLSNGAAVDDAEQNLHLLREQMAVAVRDKLPLWRKLNML